MINDGPQEMKSESRYRRQDDLPDNEAGYDGPQEGVGQDGADVSEEMSLKQDRDTEVLKPKSKMDTSTVVVSNVSSLHDHLCKKAQKQ